MCTATTPPALYTAAACCRMAMPAGPTQLRFQPKYTVNTRVPGAPAIGGGGGGGGGGTGTHAAMASSAHRTIARFIGFLLRLRNSAYKKSLRYTTQNRGSAAKPGLARSA